MGESLLANNECPEDDLEMKTSVTLTYDISSQFEIEFEDDTMQVTHLLRQDLVEMTAAGISHCASAEWGGTFAEGQVPAVHQTSTTGGYRPEIKMPDSARWSFKTHAANLEFYDYSPGTFYKIREALGVDPTGYREAFTDLSGLLYQFQVEAARKQHYDGKFQGKEVGSDGASGSFFYFTKNKQYLVKTIELSEKDALVAIADEYLAHCLHNQGTLIHYYGCHSLRLPLNSGKMYFCVMKNIFCTDAKMAETYDLKGCTSFNRRRLSHHQLDALHDSFRFKTNPTFKVGTLMDWEWMDLERQLQFLPSIGGLDPTTIFLKAMHADCEFLGRCGLLDYSLLVGIVRRDQPRNTDAPEADRRESFYIAQSQEAVRCQNMFLSLEDGDYYLGIGDILETWTMRWRMQRCFFKSLLSFLLCGQWRNPEGITAVVPDLYAARFYSFMVDKVLRLSNVSLSEELQNVNGVTVDNHMSHLENGKWW